jgi:hypothetical protein
VANDYVHDNVIFMRGVGMTGIVGNVHHPARSHNRFRRNHYRVSGVTRKHFAWVQYPLTWVGWRARGQDLTGTILPL